ncbi:reverse transcriptase domain-containing protein [Tanacetum coccineum]|uniref:Reverse transcriptase domain-containing protein n=1 Tax=Tanacetum coccineum TaxID=301880 RepID=A0ABQ4XD66_9ASTR
MADNRTMAQMLQAPIEGYEDAIVVPPINANNFELKQPLINLVQSNKFTGRQDPHNHLRFFNKVTSTFRHPEVPNTSIKLLLFPFSLDGEARDWLDKEPPRSILTWDDLVSKFINQFFPPSKTTYLRNKITNFFQEPNETFNEAWERFKGLLRQYSAAGGNFLDKMPQEGLAIIESKSKVRYSRSRASDSRVSTDAPLSNSSPSNNSFDMQQIAASLEDKMTIKMKQMMNERKAFVVTTPTHRQSDGEPNPRVPLIPRCALFIRTALLLSRFTKERLLLGMMIKQDLGFPIPLALQTILLRYCDPVVSLHSDHFTPFGESDFLLLEEAIAFIAIDDEQFHQFFNAYITIRG